MSASILDGKACAEQLLSSLQEHVNKFKVRQDPTLAFIQVGDNSASTIYVNNKIKACKLVGFAVIEHRLPVTISTADLLELIDNLNTDNAVHGILVQLPLPEHIDADVIMRSIDFQKDVDGFHPYNLGLLAQKQPYLQPCTPFGISLLLEHYNLNLSGKDVVVVGASNIVGRPAALSCLLAGATVTVCHSLTKDLACHVQRADCLIVAVGRMNVVNAEDIKPGAIVVDVGINKGDQGQIVGDINFLLASQRANWITPVPGGVGPMTVAALMVNTWQAYARKLVVEKFI